MKEFLCCSFRCHHYSEHKIQFETTIYHQYLLKLTDFVNIVGFFLWRFEIFSVILLPKIVNKIKSCNSEKR